MIKDKKINIVGIIAEYNPFHNGHAYHIQKAKELANADYCVIVMSGDFVQRGAPAIYDKYTRAEMALASGADLVLEIPSIFATCSAEDFAACSVSLLTRLGVVDSLCFGSECGDVEKLSSIASILATEPSVYSENLKQELRKGLTFPEARIQALISSGAITKEEAFILSSPNNILGIEYIKALIRQNSMIKPVTLNRKGSDYHETNLTIDRYSSATGIREFLKESAQNLNDNSSILAHVPDIVKPIMEKSMPLFTDDFGVLLNTALLRLCHEEVPYIKYADVSEELSRRMMKQLPDYVPMDDKINQLKTRQYTYTRISRALIHILLGITKIQIEEGRKAGYAPYGRILGFRKNSVPLLNAIKKRGSIPLIAKTAGAEKNISNVAASMLRQDFYSSHIYQTVYQDKYKLKTKNEFTRSVVIL
ncbi:nucleotidyltransferase [Clostridium sp. E02]|uniref:nucleotidyltransferase n=1 Tax=Clostridium sp. E02 TaxID=2487134 RepID=UPI000F530A15|nr:nucleotidyltransferase [Clostridium sp. E02]